MELDHLPSRINRKETLGSREESILMRHRTELVFDIGPGSPFPVMMDLPNAWKHDLEEKLASKIRKYCHE
jgi:hypothetical protein